MMSSIKEMQSETTTRHYYTPVRTAKLKNNKPQMMAKMQRYWITYISGGNVNGVAALKNS